MKKLNNEKEFWDAMNTKSPAAKRFATQLLRDRAPIKSNLGWSLLLKDIEDHNY